MYVWQAFQHIRSATNYLIDQIVALLDLYSHLSANTYGMIG